jgi:hypothetical protein
MAGSLIKIDEEIVTSAVASVTLGGADWDSSYDVYMVAVNNVVPTSSSTLLYQRFTVGGSPDTSANYDEAYKRLRTGGAFDNSANVNQNYLNTVYNLIGTTASKNQNFIEYLFNFNNSSEYSFMTIESSGWYEITADELYGAQGGGTLTVSQATNGVQYYFSTGNIASGTFTLYGLAK